MTWKLWQGRGNSAQLRRNLTKLIDKYLKWIAPEKESRAECLVIQIDDADLATQKIFEICEDIRNYLALPNVVILMGMDFVQFTYAIYQRYLHNYKELHDLQRGISVEEKCYDMAARYLEKRCRALRGSNLNSSSTPGAATGKTGSCTPSVSKSPISRRNCAPIIWTTARC